jgi:hypothetical protein
MPTWTVPATPDRIGDARHLEVCDRDRLADVIALVERHLSHTFGNRRHERVRDDVTMLVADEHVGHATDLQELVDVVLQR